MFKQFSNLGIQILFKHKIEACFVSHNFSILFENMQFYSNSFQVSVFNYNIFQTCLNSVQCISSIIHILREIIPMGQTRIQVLFTYWITASHIFQIHFQQFSNKQLPVVYLKAPSEQLLQWADEEATSQRARVLGASLSEAESLYLDLQNAYKDNDQ